MQRKRREFYSTSSLRATSSHKDPEQRIQSACKLRNSLNRYAWGRSPVLSCHDAHKSKIEKTITYFLLDNSSHKLRSSWWNEWHAVLCDKASGIDSTMSMLMLKV